MRRRYVKIIAADAVAAGNSHLKGCREQPCERLKGSLTSCDACCAQPAGPCLHRQARPATISRLRVWRYGWALSFHKTTAAAWVQRRRPPADATAGSVQQDGASTHQTRSQACMYEQGCTPRRLAARARLCACLRRGGCFALLPSSGVAAARPVLCSLALVQAALRDPLAPAREARQSAHGHARSRNSIGRQSTA